MATVRLTDTAIAAATKRAAETGARVEVSDAAERGLRLRITPNGARGWVLGARDPDGRIRRFALGSFPALGVAEARRAAQAMRETVRKGHDPIAEGRHRRAEAREAKAAGPAVDTLGALVDRYAAQRGKALRSWSEMDRRIRGVFAPAIERSLSGLSRFDLQRVADAHPSQQSAAAGVRYLRPVLKWAAARGTVPPELALISPPATVGRRDRVLAREELAKLLPALRADVSGYGALYRFLILTLARREEAGGARWRDVDLAAGVWTIPVAAAKNGRAHLVPLSRQAISLLEHVGSGESDAFLFATSTGRPLANHDRATKALSKASGVTGWSRHDLRRTGATTLGEMGELPDIIEAALNHVSIRSALAATYNRSRYRPQVAAALQRLADALDGIEAGGAEVVSLRGARVG